MHNADEKEKMTVMMMMTMLAITYVPLDRSVGSWGSCVRCRQTWWCSSCCKILRTSPISHRGAWPGHVHITKQQTSQLSSPQLDSMFSRKFAVYLPLLLLQVKWVTKPDIVPRFPFPTWLAGVKSKVQESKTKCKCFLLLWRMGLYE